jgi:membrane protease YdiL (CAAX protease family)
MSQTLQAQDPSRRLIAPLWHTVLVIALLIAISVWGGTLQRHGQPGGAIVEQRPRVLPLYLSLMIAEWGLVRFVWAGGLRRTGTRLRDLIGGEWRGWKPVTRDTLLAIAFWVIVSAASVMLKSVLSPGNAKSIGVLLPRGLLESATWVALSLTAGFCEEIVFRGYLQTQFFAITGSRGVAVVLQAALFGIGHAYQGTRAVVIIFVYGLLYGALALWRRSLRPGMLAHALTDIASGLLAR